MSTRNEFNDYIVELLSAHGEIRIRSMFGGHGVYCDNLFVAIIVDGALFFKTSDETRSQFTDLGCKPFSYESNGRKVSMSYFEVPAEAIDSSDDIREWLNLAIKAANQKTPTKKKPKK